MDLSPPDAIRQLLLATTVPADLADRLLEGAPALWLASAPPEVLAGDLALTHPPLREGEVRAAARPVVGPAGAGQRLAVVAHDRPGLLAHTAAAVAAAGFSVATASAATWIGAGLALHALTLRCGPVDPDTWDALGRRLRDVGEGERPPDDFRPGGPAKVRCHPSTDGRWAVTVEAPDATGLFAAICGWLADEGAGIDVVHAATFDGQICDVFLTSAEIDSRRLAAHLS